MLHIKATENSPYILKIRIAEIVLIRHISMFLLQSKPRGVAIRETANEKSHRKQYSSSLFYKSIGIATNSRIHLGR